MKPSTNTVTISKILPRIEANAEQGLTSAQARERLANGYGNVSPTSPEKTVGQIFRDNILTYFNLVFFVLGLLIVFVQSYRNLTFMPIIFVNSTIGIIQELRSRRALSKLKFVAAPHAAVVRDGQVLTIPAAEAVLDDISVFTAGNQIYADGIVLTGECRVNEALVTGESDEIVKTPGSPLLSGSFIVSGECRARLDQVGADSFVSKLTVEAKKHTKKKRTGMMGALTRLIQVIGFVIIPFGTALFLQQRLNLGHSTADSVVHTVAALVGMIPEGLYFLTSIALTISIMRLATKRTLVHDMSCIETLARVDVLCVDKTGTITENRMSVRDVVLLCPESHDLARVTSLLSDFAAAMGADNETMLALKNRFSEPPRRRASSVLAFSSTTKYSGASFSPSETFLLGAPEKILLGNYEAFRPEIEKFSAQGCRVLLFARYRGPLDDKGVRGDTEPLALVILTNGIRPQAPATFKYFRDQGVTIKVISGDNALTVSAVAQEAGIENADKYVDASTLTTERKIRSAVKEYTVFGRVTPEQKRKLIRAFKAEGHTVAMTGDGVNDVLGAQGRRLQHRHGLRQRRGLPCLEHRPAGLRFLRNALRCRRGTARHQQHRAVRRAVSDEEHLLLRAGPDGAHHRAPLSIPAVPDRVVQHHADRLPVVRAGDPAEYQPRAGKIPRERHPPGAARRPHELPGAPGGNFRLPPFRDSHGRAVDDGDHHYLLRGPYDALPHRASLESPARRADHRLRRRLHSGRPAFQRTLSADPPVDGRRLDHHRHHRRRTADDSHLADRPAV